ncbi:hypothetical protein AAF712_016540, partial [Marasmius tenuissimus]
MSLPGSRQGRGGVRSRPPTRASTPHPQPESDDPLLANAGEGSAPSARDRYLTNVPAPRHAQSMSSRRSASVASPREQTPLPQDEEMPLPPRDTASPEPPVESSFLSLVMSPGDVGGDFEVAAHAITAITDWIQLS